MDAVNVSVTNVMVVVVVVIVIWLSVLQPHLQIFMRDIADKTERIHFQANFFIFVSI